MRCFPPTRSGTALFVGETRRPSTSGTCVRSEPTSPPRDCGSANTLLVRYEDLVTAPRETVAKVLRFIGEPAMDTLADYASTSLSQVLGSQSAWHSSLRQGISTDKIGRYRRIFAPRDIEVFESIAGEALSHYGYAPDHAQARGATWLQRTYALFADRAVRWGRKLAHPYVIRLELQFRVRKLQRALFSAVRLRTQ
jgi:hypothetical protein